MLSKPIRHIKFGELNLVWEEAVSAALHLLQVLLGSCAKTVVTWLKQGARIIAGARTEDGEESEEITKNVYK